MAVPPADFILHNSLFLVAHFHNVIIGGVLFGAFAGYTYWFPKAFGFRLDERLGQAAFWCWIIGFYLAFMPLYVLGFLGMTRRMQHYDVPEWHPWTLVAAARRGGDHGRHHPADRAACGQHSKSRCAGSTGPAIPGTGGRLNGPRPRRRRPSISRFCRMCPARMRIGISSNGRASRPATAKQPRYDAVEMPRNSPTGFICAFFATIMGFALIWHIWWLVAAGAVGAFATFVVFAWRDEDEYVIPAVDVERIDRANVAARRAALVQAGQTT